jgi:hypothetical protein
VHCWIGKTFGDAVTVGLVGDVFTDGRQVILAVGILHVRQQLTPFQVLRGSAKPLQRWKHEHTPLATELLLELVDREAAVVPFPL